MTDSSPSRLEPKSLRRPSPEAEHAGESATIATPTLSRSPSDNSLVSRHADWYEQHGVGVAGPSRPRPLSDESVQTAYRVSLDEFGRPTERWRPSPITTPSIEQNVTSPVWKGDPQPGSSRVRLSTKGKEPVPREGLNEIAMPQPIPIEQRDASSLGWDGREYLEDQGESAEPAQASSAVPTRVKSRKRKGSSQQVPREGLDEVAAPRPVQRDTAQRNTLSSSQWSSSSRESASPPPSFGRRRTPSNMENDKYEPSKLATQLYTYSYLVFFSLWGTLARLGVQWLTFYPGAPVVTSVLWANVGGSVFMGFLSEDRQVFREEWGATGKEETNKQKLQDEAQAKKNHAKVKKTIPLYIGLATGFCGSFTSFSSFQRDVFLALSNNLPSPEDHPYSGIPTPSFSSTVHRNAGYSFLALVAVMLYTVALSLGGLFVGAHIAIALDPWMPTIPFRFTRRVVDRVMLFVGPLCWLGAIFLTIWPPDRPGGPSSRGTWANEVWRGEVLLALVFAPIGCLLRYYASIKLNPIAASFPLGTFAVNIFGCAVEAMLYDIQHVPLLSVGGMVGGGRVGCQVLQGMMDGFCGCLTTISTWVAELQGLRRRHAYIYGMSSLVGGLCIMIIIMGSVRWTVGWSETACVTMRTSS